MPKEQIIKIPGKLFIAGEYAVLEPNQRAIVVAINRYITAHIKPSKDNAVALPQLGFEHVTWFQQDKRLQFSHSADQLLYIQQSLTVVTQYLQEKSIQPKTFQLQITSQLDDTSGRKYGLGSSAAVVVAVVTSVLNLHKSEKYVPSLEEIFKLSAIAHYRVQGNGSAADIAASTYGGWLSYSAFDPTWLVNEMNMDGKLVDLLNKSWPRLSIKSITQPEQLQLCVGWTGEVVKTGPMVNKIQKLRQRQPLVYERFLTESAAAVSEIVLNMEQNDVQGVFSGIRNNRIALQMLDSYTGSLIETEKLKQLADIANEYGAGKSSGAGGGDCGIALITKSVNKQLLYQSWEKKGILPLELNVSAVGATI